MHQNDLQIRSRPGFRDHNIHKQQPKQPHSERARRKKLTSSSVAERRPAVWMSPASCVLRANQGVAPNELSRVAPEIEISSETLAGVARKPPFVWLMMVLTRPLQSAGPGQPYSPAAPATAPEAAPALPPAPACRSAQSQPEASAALEILPASQKMGLATISRLAVYDSSSTAELKSNSLEVASTL